MRTSTCDCFAFVMRTSAHDCFAFVMRTSAHNCFAFVMRTSAHDCFTAEYHSRFTPSRHSPAKDVHVSPDVLANAEGAALSVRDTPILPNVSLFFNFLSFFVPVTGQVGCCSQYICKAGISQPCLHSQISGKISAWSVNRKP